MEKGLTYGVFAVAILIEIVFIITAFVAITRIKSFEKNQNNTNELSKFTKYFLYFSIIGEISYSFVSKILVGKLIYCSFLIFEIFFLVQLINLIILEPKFKILIKSILFLLTIPFSLYSFYPWFENNINIFLSIESITIGIICLKYFDELKNKIESINLQEDTKTLMTIGLFFCYSAPLAFNSTLAYLTIIFPDLTKTFTINDLILYLGISRIGTICYIIFHYFIYKAFRWQKS